DDKLKTFAFRVGLTYGRSISNDLKSALKSQVPYLTVVGDAAQDVDPKWKLKISDPQANFSRTQNGDELSITLTIPVDVENDPENRAVFFNDHFTVNAKDQSLKKFQRTWAVAPEVGEPLKTVLEKAVA